MRGLRWSWLLVLATAAGAAPVVVATFDQGEPFGERWAAQGAITAQRVALPQAAPPGPGGPAGQCVDVRAAAQTVFMTKRGVVPSDWLRFAEWRCWVLPLEPLDADLLAVEDDGATWFQRRVQLPAGGWQELRLPLKWFRWGDGRVPRWDHIARLAVRFRQPTHICFDQLTLDPGGDLAAELTAADWTSLAFEGSACRTASSAAGLVLSNAAELDVAALAAHLARVVVRLQQDLPFLAPPRVAPVLLVFANAEQYRAFTPRFGRQLGAVAEPPTSDGYTLLGVATGSWDARWGLQRPTYTHEFVHAWLARAALLPNRGEWLQEGLANLTQLRFHPQANFADLVRQQIGDPTRVAPLTQLCNGQPIGLDRYWQAVTVASTLVRSPTYQPRLGALIAAFNKAGNTNLEKVLGEALGSDWVAFEAAWRAECARIAAGGEL